MKPAPENPSTLPEQLCTECGLCCNGVIFADVELQRADDPQALAKWGMKFKRPRVTSTAQPLKFCQPCALFSNGLCRIYAARPVHCRDFECALFLAVKHGKKPLAEARREIRRARRQALRVERLLRQLGDENTAQPLLTRARRILRTPPAGPLSSESAEAHSKLGIALHQLSMTIGVSFYPGE